MGVVGAEAEHHEVGVQAVQAVPRIRIIAFSNNLIIAFSNNLIIAFSNNSTSILKSHEGKWDIWVCTYTVKVCAYLLYLCILSLLRVWRLLHWKIVQIGYTTLMRNKTNTEDEATMKTYETRIWYFNIVYRVPGWAFSCLIKSMILCSPSPGVSWPDRITYVSMRWVPKNVEYWQITFFIVILLYLVCRKCAFINLGMISAMHTTYKLSKKWPVP